MGRAPCCEKVGMNKGRWTAEEDGILSRYIQENGEGSWRSLPKKAGLKRCGKSCRLRWINYLKGGLKRGNITRQEEETIVKLHSTLGNRWSVIAAHLGGRTDNEIKNYWNTHLRRKLHCFIRKSNDAVPIILDSTAHKPPSPAPKRRRGGRTSRRAMKKTKSLITDAVNNVNLVPKTAEERSKSNGSVWDQIPSGVDLETDERETGNWSLLNGEESIVLNVDSLLELFSSYDGWKEDESVPTYVEPWGDCNDGDGGVLRFDDVMDGSAFTDGHLVDNNVNGPMVKDSVSLRGSAEVGGDQKDSNSFRGSDSSNSSLSSFDGGVIQSDPLVASLEVSDCQNNTCNDIWDLEGFLLSGQDLWDEKEGLDMVSWLLQDDVATGNVDDELDKFLD